MARFGRAFPVPRLPLPRLLQKMAVTATETLGGAAASLATLSVTFEDGGADTYTNPPTSPAPITNSTTQAHSGTHSLLATGGTGATAVSMHPAFTTTTPGVAYTHTFWAFSSVASIAITPQISFRAISGGGAVSAWSISGTIVTPTVNTWTQLTVTATAPLGTTGAYFYIIATLTTSTLFYIDDVAVVAQMDGVTKQSVLSRAVTETLTETDTAASSLLTARALSEALTETDTTAMALQANKSVTETLTTADALSLALQLLRQATDTLTLVDAATRLLAVTRASTDTLIFSDTIVRSSLGSRAVTETFTETDSMSVLHLLARSVTETFSLTDTGRAALVVHRVVTDALTESDAMVAGGAGVHPVTETLTLVDAIARAIIVNRPVTETHTLSDLMARSALVARAITETLSESDTVTVVRPSGAVIATESLTITDAMTSRLAVFRALTEIAATWADLGGDTWNQIGPSWPVTNPLTETTTVALVLHRYATEALTLVDLLGRTRFGSYTAADTLTLSDTMVPAGHGIARSMDETLVLVDLWAVVLVAAAPHRTGVAAAISALMEPRRGLVTPADSQLMESHRGLVSSPWTRTMEPS